VKQKNIEDIYELSPLQQGILFHTLVAPDSGVYFEQFCYALQTQLDVLAFQKAWQRVLDRHPILRTSFYWENLDKPYQVVYRQVDLPWDFQDWRQMSLEETEKQLEVFLAADRKQGFTLSQVPLIRLALIQVADDAYQFVFSYHHILMEGWSLTWLWKEFYEFYNAFFQGQDLHLEYPRPFREYISWLQQQDISKAEIYWRETLRGFTVPTPLMMDKAGDTFSSENEDHDCQQTLLSVTTTDVLNSLTRKYHLTLNILLKGVWAILLSRYSGESDIVFGATSSGRPIELAEAESMMGLFANTLPLRVQVDSNAFLIPWLKKLQIQEVEMRQYEYSPLIQIQQWSQIPRGLPLFDSLLSFNNYLVDNTKEKLAQSMVIGKTRIFEKTNYPLTLQVYPGSDLLLSIGYDTRRFDSATINRILGHLKTLLKGIVANPEQQLRDLPLLTAQEKSQLLLEWNDTEVEYAQHQCIHQLFESQVERTPDAIAVVFEDEQLTYQELNARANQLAHYLRSMGVKPEVLVGICVERSLSMLIGILAILKAGGAYIPLDPSYPTERLAYMLEDSQPGVLLTQKHLIESLPNLKAKVICIDSIWELIADENTANPVCNITEDNLAYVIYTSGSTGKPKGAMNTHRGICNRLLWMQDAYQLTAADSVLQKTPFSFDVSVWEFFWSLIAGARLIVAQPEGHRDTNYLVNLILQQQITTLHFVPSMLRMFLEAEGLKKCRSLVRVIASGEALPAQLQQRFFNRLDAQLHNLYGPTEAAVDVTFWQCKDSLTNQKTVPIGRPIANIQIYLLDKYFNSVAVGVAGEVYIGGVGVGRGYLNRPDLTAEKFIPNPFSQETRRLYKTGDLARYLPNGEIEYIGRIDYQVKVRGFRIELGEIETLIIQHPGIQETVVVVRDDSGDSQRIVAYIVPQKEQTLTIAELRQFLELKLPNYMVPAAFVMLEALPLTPNSKVDRKALPLPDRISPELEKTFIAPQTTIEKQLALIWGQVLGLEKIGINDNFFELGGDSILSLQIISKANLAGLQLTAKQLFQHKTVAKLAAVAGTTKKIQAEQNPVTGLLELTPIQHWFFEQEQTQPHHWNQAVVLQVKERISPVALKKVVQFLQKHHDVLRSRFIKEELGFQAVIVSPDDLVPVTYLDLSALPKDNQVAQMEAMSVQLQASLNLREGPLFQVALFDLGANQPSRLVWVIHHLVVDGVSWRILIEDFQTIYQQICQEKALYLPPKTTSFQQWSSYLQNYAQLPALSSEIEYWLTIEHQPKPIPLDFPGGNNLEETASTVSVSLSVEETQILLQEMPAVYQTQINDVLLTALVQTFTQWTGETSLLVDLEGHGREELFEDVDLSRTVGWFTTIFPVYLSLENASDPPGKALKSIKEQLRAIPNRGIGYGVLRYLSGEQKIRQRFSCLPKTEVIFNYLGQFDQILPESSLFRLAQESSGFSHSLQSKRTHLLEISGGIYQGNLEIRWTYSNKLHRQTTVELLAQRFIEAVQSLISHCQSPDAGGFTPSDFADFQQSQWDQTDLDAITAAVGGI